METIPGMSSFSFPTYAFPLLYLSSMDKVTVHYDGKAYEVTKGTSLMDFLSMKEKLSYDDDPFVGALINGEYKSLHYSFNYSYTTIEPIRLFSGLGKRIYRHSICFLLSYAASRLFPDHHLEIGHSLGDGFYFHFTDMDVSEDDIQALADLMKRTVEVNLPILKEKIPYTEALRIFSGNRFSHTAELLGSRNDGDITIYTLDGYMDSAYEPIVPRTGVLSKWNLMRYEDGMLLRYPQSRDVMNIKTFVDNPLLYSVFKRSRREGEVLGCEALGQLNGLILAGKANELIQMSENMFNDRIFEVANDIRSRGRVKFIFISGPSSSGKTTFSLKLALQLKCFGYRPVKISLDNYYFTRELVPVDSDGNKDYETLEALDLEFFRQNLDDLLRKGRTILPHFSFRENRRHMDEEETVMGDATVFIVEGIHGLNPALAPDIDQAITYRIYISALTSMIIDDHNRISTTDYRMIRRAVRDYRTRGVVPEETFNMWPSIERGEKNHIFPFQNNADAMINSALPYEMSALTPQASNLLRSVKPETGLAFATARRLLKFLDFFYTIPSSSIPADSITREFIGGSVFGAI